MPARLDRFDQLIAESEQRIAEQVFKVMAMDARDQNAAAARRLLRTLEALHVEYLRARTALVEARQATGRSDPG